MGIQDSSGFWIHAVNSRIPAEYWIPDNLSVELRFLIPIVSKIWIPLPSF